MCEFDNFRGHATLPLAKTRRMGDGIPQILLRERGKGNRKERSGTRAVGIEIVLLQLVTERGEAHLERAGGLASISR